jgi:solute carrier family 6 amino acid/orphan transporter-like 15/16/17/18/20
LLTLHLPHVRFANDIELMTGSRPGIYWMICWKYLSPLTMLIIVIASFAKIIVEGSGYLAWVAEAGTTRHLDWPPWAQVLIAVLVLVSALWIPGIAIAR